MLAGSKQVRGTGNRGRKRKNQETHCTGDCTGESTGESTGERDREGIYSRFRTHHIQFLLDARIVIRVDVGFLQIECIHMLELHNHSHGQLSHHN